MKIIHCADLHLDSRMESNLPKEKAEERKKELLQTFSRMVTYAAENGVAVILIAGDLFDTASTQQIRIKKQVGYVISQHPEITFLYLRGNHDQTDYFSIMDDRPDNLKGFGTAWTAYTFGNVVITGRELSGKIADSVYNELILDKDTVNIVALHGQISTYNAKDDAPLINRNRLMNKNIDYLALGHIHSYGTEKLDSRGIWCYSGCLEGRGFDECGDKGFVLLDIGENTVRHMFVPFAARKLQEIPVTLKGSMSYAEILNKVREASSGVHKEDLVKIVLKGDISEDTAVDLNAYVQQLEPYFYFIKMEDRTQTEIDFEKYKNDVSLKGEFVRLVEIRDIPKEEKSKIIMTGLRALAGREIEL
jgi:DNA repair protein SbcD/Mre11